MVKPRWYPSTSACARSIRKHAEWKVETHMFFASAPTRSTTRRRISSAALLVKVMAMIS